MKLDECGNHVVEAGEDCDGQPGCNAQCRVTCDEKAACPAGWGCDVDAKICRTGTGTFTSVPLALPSVNRLYSADFDGDGRDDLLGVGPFTEELSSLLFLDGQGSIARQATLPVAFSAAIGDVTGDGLPDPFLGGTEVSAFNASRTRNLWPLIGSARTVDPWSHLLAADIDCDGLRDFILFEGSTLSKVQPNGEPVALAKLPYSAKDVGSQLGALDDVSLLRQQTPVCRFARGAGQACEFLALPEPGLQHLHIYGPDGLGGAFGLLSSVTLSDSSYQRAFFVDLNNDGHDDLLLTGASAEQESYGLGDGTFHSDSSQLPAAYSGKGDNQVSVHESTALIVAAGALPDQQPLLLRRDDYTDARVANLTLDDRLDVVAINSAKHVDVLRGLPNDLLNPLPIPASNLSSIEDLGDFDGDGLSDVLFTAQNDADKPPSTISLLFSPVANGSSPRQLAFPGPVRELAAGYVVDAFTEPDTNADIGVLYQGSDDSLRLGFLLGGSDQLLRSRVSADSAQELVPVREPALGHFDEASALQLAVVKVIIADLEGTQPPRLRLDLFTVDAQGSKLLDQTDLDLTWETSPHVNLEAIDQDGDGLDELYLNSDGQLMVLRHAGDHFEVKRADRSAWNPLIRQDANGDSRPDLATKMRDGQGGVAIRVQLGASPDGSAGERHELPVDTPLCRSILSQAFIQGDDDAEPELVLLCSDQEGLDFEGGVGVDAEVGLSPQASSLLLFDVDWTSDTLTLKGFPQSTNLALGLAVGDFNGDGVQDFAAGSFNPQLFLGEPRQ